MLQAVNASWHVVSTEIAYSKALSKSVCSVDLPVKTLMPQVKVRSGIGMFTADTC